MPDPLYLSLWFSSFAEAEMMPRLLAVVGQFPFSAVEPGIGYLAVHPVAWSEPTVLERRFRPGIAPEEAIAVAGELLHEDYAYTLEAAWDLWTPRPGPREGGTASPPDAPGDREEWVLQPRPVKFIAHGLAFDEGAFQENGHIQVDFGLDTPFLYEDVRLTEKTEQRVRANIQKLVTFTSALDKHCGLSGRMLWSESEENLAQKLIARLQRVQ